MNTKRQEKISKLRKHPDNPRVIKDVKFHLLVKSIKEFPEMLEKRPLIVNNDLQVLGGNMRLRAAQTAGLKEIWIDEVDWDKDQQREFIIKDNSGFGEWDWDALANDWDTSKLEDWGLDLKLDERIDNIEEEEEIELEQSVQLEPPKEYILIMAEPNSVDWEDLKETLKLKRVRNGGYKKGSPFESSSLERVIYWNEFKKRYNADSSTK